MRKNNLILSPFGYYMRKFRLGKSMTLIQMANDLKISSGLLSAMETYKRSIPDEICTKIINTYQLSREQSLELIKAQQQSAYRYVFKIKAMPEEENSMLDIEIMLELTAKLNDLNKKEKQQIIAILKKHKTESQTSANQI